MTRGGEVVRSWISQLPTIVAVVLALWGYSLRLESRIAMLETRAISLEAAVARTESQLVKIDAIVTGISSADTLNR